MFVTEDLRRRNERLVQMPREKIEGDGTRCQGGKPAGAEMEGPSRSGNSYFAIKRIGWASVCSYTGIVQLLRTGGPGSNTA